jgi:hypothetical protein
MDFGGAAEHVDLIFFELPEIVLGLGIHEAAGGAGVGLGVGVGGAVGVAVDVDAREARRADLCGIRCAPHEAGEEQQEYGLHKENSVTGGAGGYNAGAWRLKSSAINW